ncbi:hypothetical protein [Nocardioides speluncae]|uniref:hypothetical protein n=1 Tax=Nocardioides speluncae TaxID=2670337 RepID=UPI000D696404|nr:hypothetical protein [Nocardioides speluncae]
MKKLLPTALLGVTGLVTVGLLALPATTATNADDPFAKREEDAPELVLVDDDDDDDTNSPSNTGSSRSRTDNTNSVFTKVSRDRDFSRGDRTKDWTRDGKDSRVKRDWSNRQTNDRSRNDTRR